MVTFKEVEDAKAYLLKEYTSDVSELDFTDGKYVDLVLAGHNQIEFKQAEGKQYVLVPVAMDNKVQTNYTKVDLGMVVRNNVPTVSIEEIPTEVLSGTNLDVKITIEDTDNNVFDYEIYIALDSDEFTKVSSGTIQGYEITYTWKTYIILDFYSF